MLATSLILAITLLGLDSRAPGDTVPLYDNLGDHHYPVTTAAPAAQRYFDQGLRLYYAFNHAEAIRAFREAQRLDSTCAMCFWGEALSWGPNINLPMDSAAGVAGYAAVQRALAVQNRVTDRERALIGALAVRYAPVPPADRASLDSAYARAMAKVVRQYPDDHEAAVLYAESLMDLRPWNYWTAEGELQPGMADALDQLERVTAQNPKHPGACHFYIHAVEAAHPERAVACAERLAGLMPGAGHLVHMPGHIYIRVGRYLDAITANEHAVHADESYIRDQRPGVGIYVAGYYPHNYDFMAFAALMAGRSQQAVAAADKLASLAAPRMTDAPGMAFLQHHATRALQIRTRFGRWDEILRTPAPRAELLHARGMWHYARGRAFAAQGKLEEADAELSRVHAAATDPRLAGVRLEFNEAPPILSIAEHVLAGSIAAARKQHDAAVENLREAVRLEDALTYGEPPDWTIPVRQELGATLLAARRPREAEGVYREELKRFPRNGWSLAGLAQALHAQERHTEAARAEAELRQAWRSADIPLPTLPARGEEARSYDLGSCPTEGGDTVLDCRLVYRTYGRLNMERNNAVLIPTWHGGRSEHMTFLLGANAWVDTTRYFAILVDKLGNGASTSPSNSAAQPGRRFPRVTLGDMVDAQHRLAVEHLKIPQLHAVIGWSMGGMQSIAWALRHPESVDRIVSVAGTPRMGTSEMYLIRSLRTLLDLAEEAGTPLDTLALRLAELWHTSATTPAHENALPRDSVDARMAREARTDWLAFHPDDHRLQLDAISAFDAFSELKEARVTSRGALPRMLLVYMPEDHVTTPDNFRKFTRLAGADTVAFSSACGHLAPVCETAAIGVHVRRYLDTQASQVTRGVGAAKWQRPRE